MNIKRVILILLLALAFTGTALANNLQVTNVSLYKAPGQPAGTMGVKFDVSWDNSFTSIDSAGNTFFDRAWIFVKYFDQADAGGDVAWKHAILISGGTVGDYNAASGTGIVADKRGAFCRPGANQVVYWNYGGTGGNGITDTAKSFSVKVMAIEMVYVPQAEFYVGCGGTGPSGSFTDGSWAGGATIPFKITSTLSANGIEAAPKAGKLWGKDATVGGVYTISSTGANYTIPPEYPNGYKGFYMMKYEISQGQYRDFLNTLTRSLQAGRVGTTSGGYYIFGNSTADPRIIPTPNPNLAYSYRCAIRVPASPAPGVPIIFGCDYNWNGTFDESDDGEWIACAYLSWGDLCAYADWAALRPMSELEFEKAARGTAYPQPDEYVWGTTGRAWGNPVPSTGNPISVYTIGSAGAADESITSNYQFTYGIGNFANGQTIYGPTRCGIFADNAYSSGRYPGGFTYYGALDLGGNLNEWNVNVSTPEGRLFRSDSHGDGSLSTSQPADWPSASTAIGIGDKGGGVINDTSNIFTSSRIRTNNAIASRTSNVGGRVVRTSE